MRKLILIGLIFGFVGIIEATPRRRLDNQLFPPRPDYDVNLAVYLASSTCSGTFNTVISTVPTSLSHINISSGGAAGSWMTVWDAKVSTGANAVRIGSPYPTDTTADWFFNVGTSSGLIINIDRNNGRAPCIDVFNYEQ